VCGIAFAAEADVGPWDPEGFGDVEAFEEGGGKGHFGVGEVVFAFAVFGFFLAYEG